jgi:hypothetical protein
MNDAAIMLDSDLERDDQKAIWREKLRNLPTKSRGQKARDDRVFDLNTPLRLVPACAATNTQCNWQFKGAGRCATSAALYQCSVCEELG